MSKPAVFVVGPSCVVLWNCFWDCKSSFQSINLFFSFQDTLANAAGRLRSSFIGVWKDQNLKILFYFIRRWKCETFEAVTVECTAFLRNCPISHTVINEAINVMRAPNIHHETSDEMAWTWAEDTPEPPAGTLTSQAVFALRRSTNMFSLWILGS